MEKLLSARHVAGHLGLHIKTLYKMLRENRIPLDFIRLSGTKIAFRPTDVERFISTRLVQRDGSGPVRKKKPRKYAMLSDDEAKIFLESIPKMKLSAIEDFVGVRLVEDE